MARKKVARRARTSRSTRASERSPKTTRPSSIARREPERARSAGAKMGRKLDAFPDRVDIRDWFYQPPLIAAARPAGQLRPGSHDPRPGAGGGLHRLRAGCGHQLPPLASPDPSGRVSPRMLYEMARRYDEWPGEEYEGSSARGAMKGWVSHGVCDASRGRPTLHGAAVPHARARTEAQETPGGAYYRVSTARSATCTPRSSEVGILYVTLMVHEGWDDAGAHDGDGQTTSSGQLPEAQPPGDPTQRARRRRARRGHRRLHPRRLHHPELLGPRLGRAGASRCCRTRITCCTPPTCGSRSSACP